MDFKSFYGYIQNAVTSLSIAMILGGFTVYKTVSENTTKIENLIAEQARFELALDEFRVRTVAAEIKITTLETMMSKVQSDIDDIKTRITTIPDRNEINNAMDKLYDRLSDKVDRIR